MDPKVKNKINRIIDETRSIARELDDISQGLTREFKGIGAEKCANGLNRTAGKYRYVGNELRKI